MSSTTENDEGREYNAVENTVEQRNKATRVVDVFCATLSHKYKQVPEFWSEFMACVWHLVAAQTYRNVDVWTRGNDYYLKWSSPPDQDHGDFPPPNEYDFSYRLKKKDKKKKRVWEPFKFVTTQKVPSILHVNRQSRQIAHEYYKLDFGIDFATAGGRYVNEPKIYRHIKNDVICPLGMFTDVSIKAFWDALRGAPVPGIAFNLYPWLLAPHPEYGDEWDGHTTNGRAAVNHEDLRSLYPLATPIMSVADKQSGAYEILKSIPLVGVYCYDGHLCTKAPLDLQFQKAHQRELEYTSEVPKKLSDEEKSIKKAIESLPQPVKRTVDVYWKKYQKWKENKTAQIENDQTTPEKKTTPGTKKSATAKRNDWMKLQFEYWWALEQRAEENNSFKEEFNNEKHRLSYHSDFPKIQCMKLVTPTAEGDAGLPPLVSFPFVSVPSNTNHTSTTPNWVTNNSVFDTIMNALHSKPEFKSDFESISNDEDQDEQDISPSNHLKSKSGPRTLEKPSLKIKLNIKPKAKPKPKTREKTQPASKGKQLKPNPDSGITKSTTISDPKPESNSNFKSIVDEEDQEERVIPANDDLKSDYNPQILDISAQKPKDKRRKRTEPDPEETPVKSEPKRRKRTQQDSGEMQAEPEPKRRKTTQPDLEEESEPEPKGQKRPRSALDETQAEAELDPQQKSKRRKITQLGPKELQAKPQAEPNRRKRTRPDVEDKQAEPEPQPKPKRRKTTQPGPKGSQAEPRPEEPDTKPKPKLKIKIQKSI